MFERFTERARQVVTLAQQAARDAGRDRIDTAALLVGLLAEAEGLAAGILAEMGIRPGDVDLKQRRAAEPIDAKDAGALRGPGAPLPLTIAAKKALELALREALSLGHNHIGTEHILLGLSRLGEEAAARSWLGARGADGERVRAEVIRRLEGHPGRRPQAAVAAEPRPSRPRLNADGFYGIVVTMDWVRMPDGRSYLGFQGGVSVMSAQDAVGFVPTGHNSANWIARVEGPTSSVTLMGCQVRAVVEGAAALAQAREDVYVVP